VREIISLQKKDDVTLQEAFKMFISEKKAMKLADETIKTYEDRFASFGEFFSTGNMCVSVTPSVIFQFITYLQTRNPNIKTVTINNYLRHLRAVFYNFMEAGYMPRFSIKMLKCERELKETYHIPELERLLRKPDIKNVRFSEYRNWVIINYLLGTGNRLKTVSNLKIADVDFENQEIALRTVKNKKPQIIPLTPVLEKVLCEYLGYRQGKQDDYLFCNQFGDKLETSSIETAIYRYNRARGVTKTSIHLFRHTFATEYLRNGGREGKLQRLLGHATASQTNEYVHMVASDLKQNFEEFNPLEKIKISSNEKTAIRIK